MARRGSNADLLEEGIQVGRKRVERLMKAAGLRGASKRKYVTTTIRDKRQRPAADLVDRNFYADAPNVLWVADITFVPTWAGFICLAVVLDAFSGRIVGWAIGCEQIGRLRSAVQEDRCSPLDGIGRRCL